MPLPSPSNVHQAMWAQLLDRSGGRASAPDRDLQILFPVDPLANPRDDRVIATAEPLLMSLFWLFLAALFILLFGPGR